MFGWFTTIIKIFDAISWLVDRLRDLQAKLKKEELRDAVDKSVETGDQRELEKAIGSENAGKPTKEDIPELGTRPVRKRD